MRTKSQVAVVTPYFPTVANQYSGTFVLDQVRSIAALGNDVTVYLVKPWFRIARRYPFISINRDDFKPVMTECEGVRVELVRYLPFPKDTPLYHLSMALSLLAVRSQLPETVLAHTVYPLGAALSWLGVSPTVIIHGTDYRYFVRSRIQGRRIRQVIAGEKVVCVSEGLRKEVEAEGIKGARVRLIENGIPLCNRPSAPRQTGVAEFHFVYVGSLIRQKGVYELIRAFGALGETAPATASLTIIGEGVERAALERLARSFPGSSISFAGAMGNEQVRRKLADYHCLVLPSFKEGFGRVIIEMFATGSPVISTVSGGPEYLIEPASGLLVNPGDEAGLADAMREMILNYANYDPAEIRAVVRKRFDIDKQTRCLLGFAAEGA